jgi:hypothetical protein
MNEDKNKSNISSKPAASIAPKKFEKVVPL